MKKTIFILILLAGILGMSSAVSNLKDVNYEKMLYGYTPSTPLLERYNLPMNLYMSGNVNYHKVINNKTYESTWRKMSPVRITKDTKRQSVYDPLEYPLFEYPFHRQKDKDPRLNTLANTTLYELAVKPNVKKYPAPCSISIYQPEFNMLKRMYSPGKFNHKKIPFDSKYGGDAASVPMGGENFWEAYSVETNAMAELSYYSRITPGYPQGFMNGISHSEFDAYLVSNPLDTFILVVPKSIKTPIVFKEEWLGVLFIGTISYAKEEDYEKYYPNIYDVIDVVILYDRKFVDYVRL